MIAYVGTVGSGEAELMAAGRASPETMSAFQSPQGMIQLNVNPDTGYISAQIAGAIDANLLFDTLLALKPAAVRTAEVQEVIDLADGGPV